MKEESHITDQDADLSNEQSTTVEDKPTDQMGKLRQMK